MLYAGHEQQLLLFVLDLEKVTWREGERGWEKGDIGVTNDCLYILQELVNDNSILFNAEGILFIQFLFVVRTTNLILFVSLFFSFFPFLIVINRFQWKKER